MLAAVLACLWLYRVDLCPRVDHWGLTFHTLAMWSAVKPDMRGDADNLDDRVAAAVAGQKLAKGKARAAAKTVQHQHEVKQKARRRSSSSSSNSDGGDLIPEAPALNDEEDGEVTALVEAIVGQQHKAVQEARVDNAARAVSGPRLLLWLLWLLLQQHQKPPPSPSQA